MGSTGLAIAPAGSCDVCAGMVLAGCGQERPIWTGACPEELSTKTVPVAHMGWTSRSPWW